MLLRGWCSSTLLLSNPHRRCLLRPRGGIASAASRTAAFSAAPTPGDRAGMDHDHDLDLDLDHDHDHDHKKKDAMSHSFGVGYGTRSDEEGFGGVYGGNDHLENDGHHANHPEYDKSQGSEVKEKEKARNLTDDAAATGHSQDQEAIPVIKKS